MNYQVNKTTTTIPRTHKLLWCFIRNFNIIGAPLTALTSTKRMFSWTQTAGRAVAKATTQWAYMNRQQKGKLLFNKNKPQAEPCSLLTICYDQWCLRRSSKHTKRNRSTDTGVLFILKEKKKLTGSSSTFGGFIWNINKAKHINSEPVLKPRGLFNNQVIQDFLNEEKQQMLNHTTMSGMTCMHLYGAGFLS